MGTQKIPILRKVFTCEGVPGYTKPHQAIEYARDNGNKRHFCDECMKIKAKLRRDSKYRIKAMNQIVIHEVAEIKEPEYSNIHWSDYILTADIGDCISVVL